MYSPHEGVPRPPQAQRGLHLQAYNPATASLPVGGVMVSRGADLDRQEIILR